MRRMLFGLIAAAAVVVAGCNSGSVSGSEPVCGLPSGTSTVLVYPAPSATGIPDNFGTVVLGSTVALPTYYSVYVVNNSTQNAVYFNTPLGPAPTPLPSPNTTPSFANPVYQSSGNPGATFVAGSSVSVYLNNTNSNCIPTQLLGTFNVQ